ncbi:MAG: hypothetical protein JOZ75_00030 [Candidatus Dormibacteraeota bacterium]|nr:hypothetical protein [Candidatus Dormibacteraeota bacterium]
MDMLPWQQGKAGGAGTRVGGGAGCIGPGCAEGSVLSGGRTVGAELDSPEEPATDPLPAGATTPPAVFSGHGAAIGADV